MEIKAIFENMHKKMNAQANVKIVFGELLEAKGKSIIPVSKINYSIGGGEGKGPDLSKIKAISGEDPKDESEEIKAESKSGKKENRPSGKGLGGKFSNQPLGVFEITDEKTRFVPVIPLKAIIVMISIWIVTNVLKRKK